MHLLDDASGRKDSGFDASVRRMLARLFPTRPLSFLPEEHSLFRSYFLLRDLDARLEIARDTLASRKDSTALIRSRFQGGVVSGVGEGSDQGSSPVSAVSLLS